MQYPCLMFSIDIFFKQEPFAHVKGKPAYSAHRFCMYMTPLNSWFHQDNIILRYPHECSEEVGQVELDRNPNEVEKVALCIP